MDAEYEINGRIISIFHDMIVDRKQVIVFNDTLSDEITPSSGVIQGEISVIPNLVEQIWSKPN